MDAILCNYLRRSDRSQIILLQKWLMHDDNLAKFTQHLISSDLTRWDQLTLTNLLTFLNEETKMFMHQPIDLMMLQLVESIMGSTGMSGPTGMAKQGTNHYILVCQLTYVILNNWIEENMHNPVDESKFVRLKRACAAKSELQHFINRNLSDSSINGVLVLQNAMGVNIDMKRSNDDPADSSESKVTRLSYDYSDDPKIEKEELNFVFASLQRTSRWIQPISKKLHQLSAVVTKQSTNIEMEEEQHLHFDKYNEIKMQISKLNRQLKASVPLTKQLKAFATMIVAELDYLGASNIAFNDQVYALYCMSCWNAHDDLLLAICENLLVSDHIRGISIALMIAGVLLPHARLLTTPATRTFVRAVEIVLNKRPELCIHGLLARCILVIDRNSAYNAQDNTSPTTVSALSSVPLQLGANISVKKCTTSSPGSIQFELLQRSTRQLLKPDQVRVLMETIMVPLDAQVVTDILSSGIRELVDTIQSIDSLLFIHVARATTDPISHAEFINISETDRTGLFYVPWDNESLKALQSIISSTHPKLKATAISAIITNLYHTVASPGTSSLIDTVSLPSLLSTLLTIYGSHFKNDSTCNDMRNMLVKCTNSKIIVKNCLSLLDTIEKNKMNNL